MPSKTNADFKPSRGEYNNPKVFGSYVETLGYKSVKRQIESFSPQGTSLGDEFYDSADDDPKDDPSYRLRDMDLAEIGAEIVKTQQKLTASARQAQQIVEQTQTKTDPVPDPAA